MAFLNCSTYPRSSDIALDPHLFSDKALEYGVLIRYDFSEVFESGSVVAHRHGKADQPAPSAKTAMYRSRQPARVYVTSGEYAYCAVT